METNDQQLDCSDLDVDEEMLDSIAHEVRQINTVQFIQMLSVNCPDVQRILREIELAEPQSQSGSSSRFLPLRTAAEAQGRASASPLAVLSLQALALYSLLYPATPQEDLGNYSITYLQFTQILILSY